MTIRPFVQDAAPTGDAVTEMPAPQSAGVEGLMLSEDKLYVVLAVVLIVWLGLVALLVRTDRKIDRLERRINEGISHADESL